jgi:transposase
LAVIRKDATIAELSSRYEIQPTVIHRWKKEAIVGISIGFSGKQELQEGYHAAQVKKLHAKIGQMEGGQCVFMVLDIFIPKHTLREL